jgi:hypothetical protein
MKITVRISHITYSKMVMDLGRKHPLASERVGFSFALSKRFSNGNCLIAINEYNQIDDSSYLEDPSVGASISSAAILSAMNKGFDRKVGIFHTHKHASVHGLPKFSETDLESLPDICLNSFNFAPNQIHGLLLLSEDSLNCMVWLPGNSKAKVVDQISVVGYPFMFSFPNHPLLQLKSEEIYKRQSFLGPFSQALMKRLKIGVVGAGGGGSHVNQQLAHVGFGQFNVFDPQRIESSNLNRMVGAIFGDIRKRALKVGIAYRTIKAIFPEAVVIKIPRNWQEQPEYLQECDFVIAGVDTFQDRANLERECRRYLIPMLDMGMDVYEINQQFSMSGQVQLSMPGMPCMFCNGFLTKENLSDEAKRYGDAGGRPQVVWHNGKLASTAVGVLVDMVSGWTNQFDRFVYLVSDEHDGTIMDHPRVKSLPSECTHYPISQAGPLDSQFTTSRMSLTHRAIGILKGLREKMISALNSLKRILQKNRNYFPSDGKRYLT